MAAGSITWLFRYPLELADTEHEYGGSRSGEAQRYKED